MAETQNGFNLTEKRRLLTAAGLKAIPPRKFYDFLRRTTEPPIPGTDASKHIKFNLDILSPGGGVEEHYHEPPVVRPRLLCDFRPDPGHCRQYNSNRRPRIP